jgi:hypothetical protein
MQQIAQSVISNPNGGIGINPAVLEGAPPWAASIMHMLQSTVNDVAVLKLALQRRHVLTDAELMEAQMLVDASMRQAVQGTLDAIERELNQRVSQPPTDPRGSPT